MNENEKCSKCIHHPVCVHLCYVDQPGPPKDCQHFMNAVMLPRDAALRVVKGDRSGRLYKTAWYCPTCGKQQKDTYKNTKEGCYCERCGQHLKW